MGALHDTYLGHLMWTTGRVLLSATVYIREKGAMLAVFL
jgi:hypothetical protein